MTVRTRHALLLLAPSFLGVVLFYILPVLGGSVFTVWSPARGFLGAQGFVSVLSNAMFRLGTLNTAVFVLLCVPASVLLALSISFLLNAVRSASRWAQSLMLLPYILPTIAVIFVFRWAFDYSGVINRLLSFVHIGRVFWLSGPAQRFVVMALFIWKNTGFFVVILSARLSLTPKDQLEAAQLDGAGFFRQLAAVYLPHLWPTILFSIIMCTVQALDIFRECYLLFGSYPSMQTYTLQHFIYNCFHRGDYTGAVTAFYALLPVIALMVWGMLREGSHEKKS